MDHGTKTQEKRSYICMPKMFMADLEKNYQLEHGLIIMQLNAFINEGYMQAYFRDWGNVTGCKIIKNYKSEDSKAIGFVRFATGEDADKAEMAGPHFIGGELAAVRRVVSPKIGSGDDLVLKSSSIRASQPRARPSMGLGYIFEDAQWLDKELI
ncbi:heterogeneous nuclear ribonucleoproteins A2/B1-like [Gadus macrocephalus]|uniref:heterogeneous nuclear ribonucleoproteins A2/B1-like n=1 Tax=Gadus macrocephalus TaxID=80720 RepID=UPI0028CB9900|nr:heterogeneous nuclear ribonucleoproteins A2/B1-like [Gadus macrocephalus]